MTAWTAMTPIGAATDGDPDKAVNEMGKRVVIRGMAVKWRLLPMDDPARTACSLFGLPAE